MDKQLDGTTEYVDSKGHKLYQCYICERMEQIFAFQWYGNTNKCVCHRCMLQAVYKIIHDKENALGHSST